MTLQLIYVGIAAGCVMLSLQTRRGIAMGTALCAAVASGWFKRLSVMYAM